MKHPIAIVNCGFTTVNGEIPSGVILVDGGVIVAAGRDAMTPVPADARLIDAEGGMVSSGDMDASGRAVFVGHSADLVCRTRFGDVVWVMKGGVIVYPPDASPPPTPITWETLRARAIARMTAFLKQRPETLHIQETFALSGYQKRGIDLIWRFREKDREAQSLSIRVIPTLDDKPGHVVILDGPSARKLPTAGLSATQAHWWFYHHAPEHMLYCLPVPALKRWMEHNADAISPVPLYVAGVAFPLHGRVIPVARLQKDIKRTRVMPL